MGLLEAIKKFASGDNQIKVALREKRANARAVDYMKVVDWTVMNTDHPPIEMERFDDIAKMCTFRKGHDSKLVGYKSDIERKLGRRAGKQEIILKGLRRADGTVFCIYAGIRDDTQNYLMLKPYWFLAEGETEAGFHAKLPSMVTEFPDPKSDPNNNNRDS